MAKLTKSAKEVRGRKMLTVKLKEAKYHTSSSNRWLERQLNDPYVAEAKRLVARGVQTDSAGRKIPFSRSQQGDCRFGLRAGRLVAGGGSEA